MTEASKNTIDRIGAIDKIAKLYYEQEYLDLIRDSGVAVDVYFDTYHILPIIQGYWDLRQNMFNEIDRNIFDSDRTLVKSLVYFNHLKNVCMLRPHAAELEKQLEKTYLFPEENIDKAKIDNFLDEVGLKNLEFLNKKHIENTLQTYVQELQPHSESLFKANYVLDELIWSRRFSRLFEKQIINIDEQNYLYFEIMESELFLKISDALSSIHSRKRQRKTINNLRDSMALCMFHQKVLEYKKTGKRLPIMYVAGGILGELPPGIKQEFEIPHPERSQGTTINLLKDTDFFIVDAMFAAANNDKNTNDEIFSKMSRVNDLIDIYEKIGKDLPTDDINSILDIWADFKNNDFLSKIWLDDAGGFKKLSRNIVKLLRYDELVQDKTTFKKVIESERAKIKARLDVYTSDLILIEDIWKCIESFDDVIEERINKYWAGDTTKLDVFRDEGMIRFAIPAHLENEINDFWKEFLDYHHNHEFENVHTNRIRLLRIRLTQIIYDGFLKETKDYQKIVVSISVLWVFGKQQFIISLVEKLRGEYSECYQIGLIYVASIITQGYLTSENLDTIDKHITLIEGSDRYKSNYKAWIALGYIKFNVWRKSLSSIDSIRVRFSDYASQSLEHIKKAHSYLKNIKDYDQQSFRRNVRYYYALNNLIYYSMEMGVYDLSNTEAVQELMRMQSDGLYSQSRFYDTIARYYLAISVSTKSRIDKKNTLRLAKKSIDQAIKGSVFIDKEFELLQREIVAKAATK